MTYAEIKKQNKAEICWLSFISGLAQYPNNKIEDIEIITIPNRYILVLAHIWNEKSYRHIDWKYRFCLDESVLVDRFIGYIQNEFSNIEIIKTTERGY